MKPALDDKDKRIVDALRDNARISAVELADRAGVSKQVVGYRLKSLFKRGIVKQTYPIINLSPIGYSKWQLFLRYRTYNRAIQESVAAYLHSHNQVIQFEECTGSHDLAIHIWSRSHPDAFIAGLVENFPRIFLPMQIFQVYETTYTGETVKTADHTPRSGTLDKKDARILGVLADDARASFIHIAKIVGLSPNTVAHRIKQMGTLIPASRVLTAIPAFRGKILLTVPQNTQEKLVQYAQSHPEIVEIAKGVGPCSHVVEIESEHHRAFADRLLDMRSTLGIEELVTIIILNTHKHKYLPNIEEMTQ